MAETEKTTIEIVIDALRGQMADFESKLSDIQKQLKAAPGSKELADIQALLSGELAAIKSQLEEKQAAAKAIPQGITGIADIDEIFK